MTENYEYCRECGKGHRINLDESPNENYYCGCNSLNNEMADTTHDETEERLLKEIEEELRKGITRNKVLPLDWAMDRITPIIQEAIRQTKAECKEKFKEMIEEWKIKSILKYDDDCPYCQRHISNTIILAKELLAKLDNSQQTKQGAMSYSEVSREVRDKKLGSVSPDKTADTFSELWDNPEDNRWDKEYNPNLLPEALKNKEERQDE